MPSNAQQQWVLDQFTLGIGSVELQRHVQFGHANNLNEAISLAIEFEAFESGTRIKKPLNRASDVVCAVTPEVTPPAPAPAPAYRQQNSSQRNSNMSNVTCFYCKKTGHMIRECTKLKYKQENGQNTWQNQPYVYQPSNMQS